MRAQMAEAAASQQPEPEAMEGAMSIQVPPEAAATTGAGSRPSPKNKMRLGVKKVQMANTLATGRRRPRGMSTVSIEPEKKTKGNLEGCCSARPTETDSVRRCNRATHTQSAVVYFVLADRLFPFAGASSCGVMIRSLSATSPRAPAGGKPTSGSWKWPLRPA